MIESYSNRNKTANRAIANQPIFQKKSKREATATPSSTITNEGRQKQHNPNGLPADIQASAESVLGANLSQVRVHQNSTKASQINSLAYTKGHQIHFAPGQYNPQSGKGKELIGHELTHVVQQSQGKVKPDFYQSGTAINSNPKLEQDADRKGQQIAGKSSTGPQSGLSLKGNLTHRPGGVIQKYSTKTGAMGIKHDYDRISNDGKLAVKDHGTKGFAEDSMITRANTILAGLHSIAKVKKTGVSDNIPHPRRPRRTTNLHQFSIVNRATGRQLSLRDDCGYANQQLMGSAHHGTRRFEAVYGRGRNQKTTTSAPYYRDDRRAGGNLSTTEQLSGQIYIDIFKNEFRRTLTREEALTQWDALRPGQKRRLSRKYRINEYAVPEMGQSITIGSERDMPGARRGGYNFHFGFSLMKSGPDYITLEDYARSGVPYYLDMYGPTSQKQAWAQASSNTNAMNSRTTTMVVEHPNN